MALFRTHNAAIALRESSKAGIAITLIKAFTRFPIAVHAVDYASILKLQLLAQIAVQRNFMITYAHGVRHRIRQHRSHFPDGTDRQKLSQVILLLLPL
jgi:hypothetical protein